MDIREEMAELLSHCRKPAMIRGRSLPEIDLYMDQVTTFMEEKLKNQRRYPEDKILTKTMINNYTKNRLLPAPVKKKYSQDHLLTLLYTYYLKNIIPIGDITALMKPMTDRYWDNFRDGDEESGTSRLSMREIYDEILALEPESSSDFKEDISAKAESASRVFTSEDLTEEERDYLQKFTFCILLAFDIYRKKQLMENIIDSLKDQDPPRK